LNSEKLKIHYPKEIKIYKTSIKEDIINEALGEKKEKIKK